MSKSRSNIVVGGPPRVNLLPPEVALRKKARSARRGLVALVVVVVLVVAGGYALASLRALVAEAELAAAQARTADLLGQQLEYSDVTTVIGQVQAVQTARSLGSSTEVLWNDYYVDVRNALPAGATLTTFTADGRAPWEPEVSPAGPLRQARVATLTFVVSAPTPINASELLAKLQDVLGFADSTIDILEREEVAYSTSFTLNLGSEALANRFPSEVAQ